LTLKADLLTDLDSFLDEDDFATEATWNGETLTGLFDNGYEAAGPGGEVSSGLPSITFKDSDISGMLHGDVITIETIDYNVLRIEPDGTGLSTIYLSQD